MEDIERRTIVKSAAWALPVILAAVAVPQSSASSPTNEERYPVSCEYLQNHGHGGDKSNKWWLVTFSDNTTEILDNGTVQSNKRLKELCGRKIHN